MYIRPQENDLVFSNVAGEAIPFSIGDPSIIIDIIRKKIYSNPVSTMVQEYLSNARDACVEAGKDASHIHVSLPNAIKPEFVVRDYGVGMSEERVKDVFVRYGISTKRINNSQLGYFGIGAKSGWAVADSFIVESFYEGIRREYIADIGDNKEGRLLLFKQTPTEEENGVLIKIPISQQDFSTVKKAYIRTVWLWDKRPVLETTPQVGFDIEATLPKILLDLGDVRIFHNKDYFNGSPVQNGFYLNAGGIPFKSDCFPFNNVNILGVRPFGDFCNQKDITIVVDSEPSKMGISANREGFSNKKYAQKQVTYAMDKIVKHIQDQYISPYATYRQVYKDLGVLSELWASVADTYNFMKFSNGTVSVQLKRNRDEFKSYALKIFYNTRFNSSLTFVIPESQTVYKSRSKGELISLGLKANEIKAPILLPETRKTLTTARRQDLDRSETGLDRLMVLFQNNLTDDEYNELAEIVGATEYLEDVFKDIKVPRIKKEKREKGKEKEDTIKKVKVIKVQEFKPRQRRSKLCVKNGWSYTLIELVEMLENKSVGGQTLDVIFYGKECLSSLYNFLNAIPKQNKIVFSKDNLNDINPKFIDIANYEKYIKDDVDLFRLMQDTCFFRKHRCLCKYFLANKVFTSKFDLTEFYNRIAVCKEKEYTNVDASDIRFHLNTEPVSVIEDFLKKYPLFYDLSFYDNNAYFKEHIQLYMSAVDKFILPIPPLG